jgi:hypothetical protein
MVPEKITTGITTRDVSSRNIILWATIDTSPYDAQIRVVCQIEQKKPGGLKIGKNSGYIRFRGFRFYAEAGLAKQEVSIHIYTSTLKIEYQGTELAFYTMEWAEDNKHIKEVKNPRVIEIGYRSPQLTRLPARSG